MSTQFPKEATDTPAQFEGFFSVSLVSLPADTVAEFELYVASPERKLVLYRCANIRFTQEDIDRITEMGVRHLYIPSEQAHAYNLYVERNLSRIVSDSSLPPNALSEIVYTSAKTLVKDIFAEPRAKNILERSSSLVDGTVTMMFRESRAFHHLLSVMSFDYYTYTHSVNVMVFSSALAQRLGYSQQDITIYGQGALLHDIGKSLIDPAIVNSRSKLTPEQWAEMRKHPLYGYDLLVEQGVTHEGVLDVMRHHHEKLTGTGYPDGLKGDAIHPWVRICTIADIFDALTTRRSYKTAMDSFPGLKLMHDEMLDELDPEFFRAFVQLMGQHG